MVNIKDTVVAAMILSIALSSSFKLTLIMICHVPHILGLCLHYTNLRGDWANTGIIQSIEIVNTVTSW